MKKIFISYSRNDAAFALQLAQDVQKAGKEIWIDQLHIRPSEPWDEEIEKGLSSCNSILVILSETSVLSDNVLNEINYGLEEKKQVLPIIIHNNIKKPFNIRRLQHIDFTGSYDVALNKLIQALQIEQPVGSTTVPAPGEAGIDGKWSSAELVNPFDANDKYKLFFEFESFGNILTGTITKTAVSGRYEIKKSLCDGSYKENIISFHTVEQSILGADTVSFKDTYLGSLQNDQIKFLLQSDRPWGFPPQKFFATRG